MSHCTKYSQEFIFTGYCETLTFCVHLVFVNFTSSTNLWH